MLYQELHAVHLKEENRNPRQIQGLEKPPKPFPRIQDKSPGREPAPKLRWGRVLENYPDEVPQKEENGLVAAGLKPSSNWKETVRQQTPSKCQPHIKEPLYELQPDQQVSQPGGQYNSDLAIQHSINQAFPWKTAIKVFSKGVAQPNNRGKSERKTIIKAPTCLKNDSRPA